MPSPSDPRPRRFTRPYAIVGGRTRGATADLPIEAIIMSTSEGRHVLERLRFEHRDIVALCYEPTSVAEIASNLRVPWGVARVLVGDLSANRLVDVHTAAPIGDGPDLILLERVLDGLRAL